MVLHSQKIETLITMFIHGLITVSNTIMIQQLEADCLETNRIEFNKQLEYEIKWLSAKSVKKRIKNAIKCRRKYVFLFNMQTTGTNWWGKVLYNIDMHSLESWVCPAEQQILDKLELPANEFHVVVCPNTISVCLTWDKSPYDYWYFQVGLGSYDVCYD